MSGPGGVTSFLNNGDGTHNSGGYSVRTFNAWSGLGIDVDVSTPVTSTHWQAVYIQLDADLDSVALARWDHLTAFLPRPDLGTGASTLCVATVPAGEGHEASGLFGLQARLQQSSVANPRTNIDGRWYRMRVQLFPDGRCGVAVDGRPVWVSGSAIALDRPFHVVLQGNSDRTRMLVGPLEVWEGVRGDVDWRVVGARRTR